jgi:hypothetical protein
MSTPQSSGLAQVEWDNHGVHLFCTDDKVLDALLAELENLVPTYKVGLKRTTISGQTVGCYLEGFRMRDQEVGRWLVTQLCQQGWEPFEAQGILAPSEGFVKFRRRIQG